MRRARGNRKAQGETCPARILPHGTITMPRTITRKLHSITERPNDALRLRNRMLPPTTPILRPGIAFRAITTPPRRARRMPGITRNDIVLKVAHD